MVVGLSHHHHYLTCGSLTHPIPSTASPLA
uniref:Uncharacterized protein n=1 Tax=Arundo donax TaxID=35708 RepID=A0A0A9BDD5_ARUDO